MPFDANKYLAKYHRQMAKAQVLNFEGDSSKDSFVININPRVTIQAPKGKVLVSADYASQEARIAGVVSKDPIMLKTFLPDCEEAPDLVPVPEDYSGDYQGDENLGKNHAKDLHTITAQAAFPKYFEDKPDYEWRCIAENTKHLGQSLRKWAKFVTFGTIYMQAAVTMSDLHKIPVKEAEKMIDGFNLKYAVFYDWQQTQAALGAARGWIKDGLGRQRWTSAPLLSD